MVRLRTSSKSSKPRNCVVQSIRLLLCALALAAVVFRTLENGAPPLFRVASVSVSLISQQEEETTPSSKLPDYNPVKCLQMVDGHCDGEAGGAWSYRTPSGKCVHTERSVPKDPAAVQGLPGIFPGVTDVMDFGGGLGPYLTGFRDAKVPNLVVFEPRPIGECLFRGLKQDTTDLVNTPLSQLPKEAYDLVMTIEVVEHIPHQFHTKVVDALTQATRKWLLFSAAHPGQGGEGHVEPSMKTRDQWIKQLTKGGILEIDIEKTQQLWEHTSEGSLLKENAIVMRRKEE